jgi:AraC-like DNA-binding protein
MLMRFSSGAFRCGHDIPPDQTRLLDIARKRVDIWRKPRGGAMAGYFFPGGALGGAAELIRDLGGDPAAVCRGAGLPPDALDRPDIPLPGRAVFQLFELAAEACGCRDFGLRLAGRSSLAILGPLWVLLRNAGTVRQLLQDLVSNFDIFTRAATARMEPSGDGVVLCWDAVAGLAESTVQATEFAFALPVRELRTHLPAGWQPPLVQFRHQAPARLEAHQRLFGPQLYFEQDRNAVQIDGAALAVPLNPGAAGSRTRAVMRALLRQEEGGPDPGVDARVESIVRALLPFMPCTVEVAAKALGLPTRTLQAHLQGQGRSFKEIKDAVRADLALKYLRHSSLSLSEIAAILGYSELSAFSRSFRRWHGVAAISVRRRTS